TPVRRRADAADLLQVRLADVPDDWRTQRFSIRACDRVNGHRASRDGPDAHRRRLLLHCGVVAAPYEPQLGLRPVADEFPVANDGGPALQFMDALTADLFYGALGHRLRLSDRRATLDRAQRAPAGRALPVQA